LLSKQKEIDIRLNLGGDFGDEQALPFGTNPWDPQSLALGRFRDPSELDVAYTTLGDPMTGVFGSAGLLYGGPTGSLTFGPVVHVNGYPGQVAAADFDGDDQDELVTTTRTPAGDQQLLVVSFSLGCRASADLMVTLSPDLPIPAVAAGDLDGDGHPDIVLLAGANVYLFRGRGDVTFEDPVVLPLGVSGADHMFLTDLNSDARLDIVFDSPPPTGGLPYKLFVLLNQTSH
jgi:hypothetical protein